MLERLKVAVRLREPMEAVDLGHHLLREHLGAVYRPWLLALAFLVLPLIVLAPGAPWIAPLAVWWLKPLLDRLVLHVLARAQFGEVPGTWQTLRALPSLLRHGAAAGLLWRRLSPQRSFLLPLWQLEGQDGPGFRKRAPLVLRQGRGTAQLLTLAFVHFELGLQIAILVAIQLFVPRQSDFNVFESFFESDPTRRAAWAQTALALLPVAATALVEPFYVAGGFTLYLNRRIHLEGWDLELAFRRLAMRIQKAGIGVILLLAALLAPLAAQEPPPTPARRTLEEVLQAPEFQTTRTVKDWRWKPKAAPKKAPRKARNLDWMGVLVQALASAAKGILISLVLLALVLVLWRYRAALRRTLQRQEGDDLPLEIFGLDLRPDRLPADIPGTARRLWQEGNERAALSLLYRGALSALVHGHQLPIPRGATERDCLRLAAVHLDPEGGAYFHDLTGAWERTAYGHQLPRESCEALVEPWARHFHSGAPR